MSQVMQQPKMIYYKNNDFIFEYERLGNIVGLHCQVFTWKPSVLRFGYSVFKTFLEFCKSEGVVRIVTITPNPRFAKLFGGVTTKQFLKNNIEYEVVEWVIQ